MHMILGGGSSCQQCGCKPDPCGPCRHYTDTGVVYGMNRADCKTANLTAKATVTVNGYTETTPALDWNANGVSVTLWEFQLSGLPVTSCLPTPPSTVDKQSIFSANLQIGEINNEPCPNCNQCKFVVTVKFVIYPQCNYTFLSKATWCSGLCSDTGGTLSFSAWQVKNDSDCGGVPSDCAIDTLDWLADYPPTGSISYDACTCPP